MCSTSKSTLGDVVMSENVELSTLNLRYQGYRLSELPDMGIAGTMLTERT